MRIGIYHEPVHRGGQSFDTYGPYARYITEFARHFDRVIVFAPTTDQPTYFSGCPLEARNVAVAPLPFFLTHAQALRRAGQIARVFRGYCDELDAVNCRGTAPLAYLLWWFTRKRDVPFIYHFASDPFEMLVRSPKYRGPYGLFARAAYTAEFQIQKYIMRRNYSFASGSAIYQRLRKYTPNIEPIMDSSLQAEDYYLREDCCRSRPIRLLYVGGLRQGKGLEALLGAVKLLRQGARDVVLDLVGDGTMRQELADRARALGIAEHVRFRGFVVMGPELNACYNAADIFMLPSVSEGSPRVVLEAFGHSLPVVATPVGNVSEMLDGGRRGVLVPVGDSAALAAGVARIIDDEAFRKTCITDGFKFAHAHGLDAFAGRVAEKIRQLVAQNRSRA
jgi:glycosyltransferase involved in cell wall biosynthesis